MSQVFRSMLFFPALLVVIGAAQAQTPGVPANSALLIDERLRNLQQQLMATKQGIAALEQKLPGMHRHVSELLEKVYSVKRADSPSEAKKVIEEKPQAMTVKYRPPLFVRPKNPLAVFFVCKEGRLFVIDLVGWKAGAGDFELVRFDLSEEARLRPNRSGESDDQIKTANSVFATYLKKLRPKDDFIPFRVFPDSFDIFRIAREIAWERGFAVGWDVQGPGSRVITAGRLD